MSDSCNPMDCSLQGSSVHGIFQARVLEWVAIYFLLQGIFPTRDRTQVSHIWRPTPVILPGKFHGQRSLVGYSPWGCKESDMTEQLHSLTHTVLDYWFTCLWSTWSFAQFKLLLRRHASHVHLGSSIIWPVGCKLELPVGKRWPMEDGGSRQTKSLSAWSMVFSLEPIYRCCKQ